MKALLAALALSFAGGCGDGEPCVTGVDADGVATIDAGAMCLRDITARVRRDGVWLDGADAPDIELAETGAGVLVTLVADGPVEAFELQIPRVAADRMLQQGYQSWSFSGVTKIPRSVTLDDDGAAAFPAPASGNVFDEEAGVSYGSAVVGDGDGPYLAVGAASAERANTGIAATGRDGEAELSIVYGASREPLGAGAVRSEAILLAAEPGANQALADLRAAMTAALPEGTPPPRRPPGGWFSWNEHFDQVDQALIRDHIAFVRDQLAPAGMPLVEIDDGWEIAWGDWTENDRFPDGLAALAGEARADGLVAGVWLAPFLVDTDSATAATIDPSFLVRDAGGQPIVHRYSGNPHSYYVLDGSDPEAFAVATDAVARLSAAGFRFFKLDFLYAGAFPGQRRNDVTGVEALRNGLMLLRQAAGPDAVINACGAPIEPVIGLADSLRVGADTAFVPPVGIDWSMVAFAARSDAARAYLFPLVWPDADQAQLRSPFSADQARASAAAAALAGGAYSLGDDLTALDAERLAMALDPTIVDIAGGDAPALPVDLMANPTDVVVTPALEALQLPGETAAPPPTTFEVTGKSGARYRVEFRWSDPQGVDISPQ